MGAILFFLIQTASPQVAWRSAVESGDESALAALLAAGWQADGFDEDGATPLLRAILIRQEKVARLLLEKGADPAKAHRSYLGMTPLMAAAMNNDLALADLLHSKGAPLDTADENGDPAINWAAYYGFADWVKWALEKGANWRIRGHGNALEIAQRRGKEDVVRAILQVMPTAEGDGTERTPLMLACIAGDVPLALSRLTPEEARRSDAIGFTAVHHACREGQLQLLRALVAAGASLSAQAKPTALGMRPVHLAAASGQVAVLEFLHSRGESLDVQDGQGVNPFAWALSESQKEAALWLLRMGASAELPALFGASAKEACAAMGWQEAVELLESRQP